MGWCYRLLRCLLIRSLLQLPLQHLVTTETVVQHQMFIVRQHQQLVCQQLRTSTLQFTVIAVVGFGIRRNKSNRRRPYRTDMHRSRRTWLYRLTHYSAEDADSQAAVCKTVLKWKCVRIV